MVGAVLACLSLAFLGSGSALKVTVGDRWFHVFVLIPPGLCFFFAFLTAYLANLSWGGARLVPGVF